jgi:MFS family permease
VEAIPEEDLAAYSSSLKEMKSPFCRLRRWWLMAGIVLLTAFYEGGLLFLTGLHLEAIAAELGVSLATAAGIGSLQTAVAQLAAMMAGWFIDGPRALALIGLSCAVLGLATASLMPGLAALLCGQSLLAGAGLGFVAAAAQTALLEAFSAESGLLAQALDCWGAAAGALVVLPSLGLLHELWDRRTALMCMAGLAGLCVPAALGLRGSKGKVSENGWQEWDRSITNQTNYVPIQELFIPRDLTAFCLIQGASLLAVCGLSIVCPYIRPVAELAHLPAALSLPLIGCLGIGGRGGRLLAAWLRPWCRPQHLTRAALASAAALPLFLASVQSAHLFLLLAAGVGLLAGFFQAASGPFSGLVLMTSRHRPCEDVWPRLLNAGAALVGPPLAGLLVAKEDSQLASLYLASGLITAASLIYSLGLLISLKQQKFNQYEAI